MAHPDVTKEVFLWGMSVIYLFAFASLYYQIPGLYGDKGILPIKPELKYECKDGSEHCSSWAGRGECDRNPDYMLKQCQKSCKVCTACSDDHAKCAEWAKDGECEENSRYMHESCKRSCKLCTKDDVSVQNMLRQKPTLLWLLPMAGLDEVDSMELLALCGIVIALLAVVSKAMRSADSFLLLWGLYFSCYQVGQTFMWFQWDILLLEAGFITILVAPFNLVKFGRWATRSRYHDNITLWLVRWLLFRLMFASGVVKLQSQCPTWWGLTAMNYHYESQCIPTPLAWYAHQIPEWLQKLSTVVVYMIEIPGPFLFFAPSRRLRLFAFWCQVFLMVGIILTGNYNFFNLLTIVLSVPLLDDFFFTGRGPTGYEMVRFVPASLRELVALMLEAAFAGSLLFYAHKLFSLSLDTTRWKVDSKVVFTPQQLDWFVRQVLPLSIIMGAASLSLEVCDTIVKSLKYERKLMRRLWALLGTIVFSAAAFSMFSISLVSLTTLDDAVQKRLPQPVMYLYGKQRPFTLTSSYGLFRRMTGVGGRPELILEASNNLERGWKEYSFLYKPGNISTAPPVVFPHQPRLDWQMWFAALGHHERNPWFLSLVQRLLEGEPTVLQLMGPQPFKKAPKYIRASVYHYHYTTAKKGTSTSKNWWWREKKREYLPAVTLDSKLMLTHAKTAGLQEERSRTANVLIKQALDYLRFHVNQLTASALVWALFLSTVVVMLVRPGRRL